VNRVKHQVFWSVTAKADLADNVHSPAFENGMDQLNDVIGRRIIPTHNLILQEVGRIVKLPSVRPVAQEVRYEVMLRAIDALSINCKFYIDNLAGLARQEFILGRTILMLIECEFEQEFTGFYR